MTFDEADALIKNLKGPFAHVADRASGPENYNWKPDGMLPRYYVGWSPCYGNGNTWEEAFADLRRNRAHIGMRPTRLPKHTCKCIRCRAPKEVLRRRFSK